LWRAKLLAESMPELAEVEHYRRVAESVALGRTIARVHCADDDIVVDGTTANAVRRALTGRRVEGTGRHGKHMWLELDERPWLTLHFGMTGMMLTPTATPLALASGIDGGPSWPPRFTKLRLTFDDGGEVAMTNARRLGRIRLRDDPRGEPPIAKLGFDPHLDMPPPAVFVGLVRRRKILIKALLLDQGFAAGVGNWVADEALYQARIDPRRRAGELSDEETRRLRLCLKRVVDTAVEVDARSADYPKTWLFHHRWGKKDGVRLRGQPVEYITIAGRTTAWVPTRQR
jgi:formamidopyrimidine-DNA glycosylase